MGLSIKEKEKREKERWLKDFGQHLKKIRQEKGISGGELGRLLFMDQPNISRLENGKVNPSLYLIKQISDALEMSIQEFLEDFTIKG